MIYQPVTFFQSVILFMLINYAVNYNRKERIEIFSKDWIFVFILYVLIELLFSYKFN
jgi:hypothetical protein